MKAHYETETLRESNVNLFAETIHHSLAYHISCQTGPTVACATSGGSVVFAALVTPSFLGSFRIHYDTRTREYTQRRTHTR